MTFSKRASSLQQLEQWLSEGKLSQQEYEQQKQRLQTDSSVQAGADFFATGGVAPSTPFASPNLPPPLQTATQTTGAAPDVGDTLMERYCLLSKLGEGGMGQVFLATDELTGQKVALKWVHPHLMEQPGVRERFINELTLTQKLTHPGIVRSYSLLEDPQTGLTFFTMEQLHGMTLEEKLQKQRRSGKLPLLSEEEMDDLLWKLTDALDYAHQKGVIHRDIKPANIFLCMDGQVKLMDFGIARAFNQTGQQQHTGLIGTAYYMAPEQMRGGEVTPASDIFSLGVILYELLTGELPLGRVQPPSRLVDAVPRSLDRPVMRALEASLERRFHSVMELAEEFTQGWKSASRGSSRRHRPSRPGTGRKSSSPYRLLDLSEQFIDHVEDTIGFSSSKRSTSVFSDDPEQAKKRRKLALIGWGVFAAGTVFHMLIAEVMTKSPIGPVLLIPLFGLYCGGPALIAMSKGRSPFFGILGLLCCLGAPLAAFLQKKDSGR